MDDNPISDTELEALAALAGLTLPAHCRDGVRLHLATARRMLAALEPLVDDARESAQTQVVKPGLGNSGTGRP